MVSFASQAIFLICLFSLPLQFVQMLDVIVAYYKYLD